MKRYFEVLGKRQTLLLDLRPSLCAKTTQELSEQLKMPLVELTRSEYQQLTKKYTEGKG